MSIFKLKTPFKPSGDQEKAIKEIVSNFKKGKNFQVLLGVTGSGKTFTMANVIKALSLPTLIITHNKTLTAQLYREFKEFFPENAVEYFVSYYDYYQPEAYVPESDTYIEKESSINDEIDRMRHSATVSLLTRRDVIIVASVSCIYGLGSVDAYSSMLLSLREGDTVEREEIIEKLSQMRYSRNEIEFKRGTFRVKGDIIEIYPVNFEDRGIRVELFDDEITDIFEIDPLRGKNLRRIKHVSIFPQTHYVVPEVDLKRAIVQIKKELKERIKYFEKRGKYLEAERIKQRTTFDIEMMEQMGYCNGIENYSRYLSGRKKGEPPYVLIDYFPDDFLMIIDESHVTIPQIRGMYNGDRSRKESLVKYGFRLPSALDNRPLKFEEFEKKMKRCLFVSATPAEYEIKKAKGVIVEQIIRPTGLLDPEIVVKPCAGQVDDLYSEIKKVVERGERALVTTLTKKFAVDLAQYYSNLGLKVRYLHSEIDALERARILFGLRKGDFDVIVGINLLREGLDLPEVSLVGILDADKEGFLRSERSLIQIAGRAARNVNGKVILYADRITRSIEFMIEETNRRRKIQKEYNKVHNIKPKTVKRKLIPIFEESEKVFSSDSEVENYIKSLKSFDNIDQEIKKLEKEMKKRASNLEFEEAIKLRDKINALKKLQLILK